MKKYTDTPLGKAFLKAKDTNTPPPPPAKTGDNADVATRRYKYYQQPLFDDATGKYAVRVGYDKSNNKISTVIINTKTNKIASQKNKQWHQFTYEANPAQKDLDKFTASIGRAIIQSSKGETPKTLAEEDDLFNLNRYLTQFSKKDAEYDAYDFEPSEELAPGTAPKRKPDEPNALKIPPAIKEQLFPEGYRA